jgi:hypothetical protein
MKLNRHSAHVAEFLDTHDNFFHELEPTNPTVISAKRQNWNAMRFFLLSVILLFSGCRKSSAPAPPVDAPPFRSPTATEVFDLRSKCADLGEKIMKNTAIADALAKDQLSHYEPKTNRCYVQLTVQNPNPAKRNEYFRQYLFDGQTGQVLAEIRREKGTRSGDIYIDPSPLNGNSDELYVDASIFIRKMMTDDAR